jgi:hypothetical protein
LGPTLYVVPGAKPGEDSDSGRAESPQGVFVRAFSQHDWEFATHTPIASDELATARMLITMLQDQVTTLRRENASLRHQLDVLCQRLVGKKSERVDPRQLHNSC